MYLLLPTCSLSGKAECALPVSNRPISLFDVLLKGKVALTNRTEIAFLLCLHCKRFAN
jgi:hypothetical protein